MSPLTKYGDIPEISYFVARSTGDLLFEAISLSSLPLITFFSRTSSYVTPSSLPWHWTRTVILKYQFAHFLSQFAAMEGILTRCNGNARFLIFDKNINFFKRVLESWFSNWRSFGTRCYEENTVKATRFSFIFRVGNICNYIMYMDAKYWLMVYLCYLYTLMNYLFIITVIIGTLYDCDLYATDKVDNSFIIMCRLLL